MEALTERRHIRGWQTDDAELIHSTAFKGAQVQREFPSLSPFERRDGQVASFVRRNSKTCDWFRFCVSNRFESGDFQGPFMNLEVKKLRSAPQKIERVRTMRNN